ncbi:MAG: hypothetical protein Q9219_002643 [cf. Caloplaca sp. 3 TL-2023]
MGFFRRLVNGRKRMEGFQGPKPKPQVSENGPVPVTTPSGAEVAADRPEVCEVDDISVASYESGDEVPLGHHQRIPNDLSTTSTKSCTSPYPGSELSTSEFRILTLSPASHKDDAIHCTMEKTNFKTNPDLEPKYEALSYTWGDPTIKCLIHVDDKPFAITTSLYIALKYLRKSKRPRTLWIDAICINQEDLAEKTHQVSMMRSIYGSASGVLVWLGESDKDIRKAMALLKRMDKSNINVLWPAEEDLAPFKPGLDKLFNKPWWSRLWVVQEVIVASTYPTVGCGRMWVPWSVVKRAMLITSIRGGPDGRLPRKATTWQDFAMLPVIGPKHPSNDMHWGRKLKDLLLATSDRDSTLPHDKIFALLGMTTKTTSDQLQVDYTQPFAVIYQQAMAHILKSGPTLNFLRSAINPRANKEIPSWCVDFSKPGWNDYFEACRWCGFYRDDTKKGASGNQEKAVILHDPAQGTIGISGTVVGSINYPHVCKRGSGSLTRPEYTQIMAQAPFDEQRQHQWHIFNFVLDEVKDFAVAARSALESRLGVAESHRSLDLGAIWKTVTKGRSLRPSPMSTFSPLSDRWKKSLPNDYAALEKFAQKESTVYGEVARDWSCAWANHPHGQQAEADIRFLEELEAWAFDVISFVGFELKDETFIMTDSGYLGNAPTAVNEVEMGDLVCIIHGCSVPAILRSQGEAYTLVTFSYVTDLMDGEFFQGSKRQTREFTLR